MRTGITFIAALALLLLASCVSHDTSARWPVLSLDHDTHNFEPVDEGAIVVHSFPVTNKGMGELRILDVKVKSGSVTAFPVNRILKAGESSEIKVRFNTLGHFGQVSQKIQIHTNDPERLKYNLKLAGKVLTDFSLDPKTIKVATDHDRDNRRFGWSNLTNESASPMVITSLAAGSDLVVPGFKDNKIKAYTIPPGQAVAIEAELKINVGRKKGRDEVIVNIKGRENPIIIPVQSR